MAQNQPYSHPHPHRHSYQQRHHRRSHTSLQPVTSFVATLTNNPSIPRPCKYQLSPRGCHFDTDCWYAHYSFQHEYQPSTNDAHIQQQLKQLRQQIQELTDLVKSLPSAETALSESASPTPITAALEMRFPAQTPNKPNFGLRPKTPPKHRPKTPPKNRQNSPKARTSAKPQLKLKQPQKSSKKSTQSRKQRNVSDKILQALAVPDTRPQPRHDATKPTENARVFAQTQSEPERLAAQFEATRQDELKEPDAGPDHKSTTLIIRCTSIPSPTTRDAHLVISDLQGLQDLYDSPFPFINLSPVTGNATIKAHSPGEIQLYIHGGRKSFHNEDILTMPRWSGVSLNGNPLSFVVQDSADTKLESANQPTTTTTTNKGDFYESILTIRCASIPPPQHKNALDVLDEIIVLPALRDSVLGRLEIDHNATFTSHKAGEIRIKIIDVVHGAIQTMPFWSGKKYNGNSLEFLFH